MIFLADFALAEIVNKTTKGKPGFNSVKLWSKIYSYLQYDAPNITDIYV